LVFTANIKQNYLLSFDLDQFYKYQGWIQPVSVWGSISATFGSQVS